MKKMIRTPLVVLLGAAAGIALVQPLLPPPSPLAPAVVFTAYLPPARPASAAATAVVAAGAGRAWEVYFTEGQHVRKGQVLVKVAEKLRTAEQHRLQQQLTRQQLAYEVLAARHPAVSAPVLAAAEAKLAATRQLLQQAPAQFSFLFVTAPQDGVVASRTVAPGDYLAPGTTVATLLPPALPAAPPLLSSAE